MGLLIDRSAVVTAICAYLRTAVPELKLVKPYHGELDQYSKKMQVRQSTFPAEVSLATPFALVISKDRRRDEHRGSALHFRHDVSIYIGDANRHDFGNVQAPPILDLLSKCSDVLHGHVLIRGASALMLDSDGEYITTTDLFVVYDQKYHQLEIGR